MYMLHVQGSQLKLVSFVLMQLHVTPTVHDCRIVQFQKEAFCSFFEIPISACTCTCKSYMHVCSVLHVQCTCMYMYVSFLPPPSGV